MRITESQLRKIIREEISSLNESSGDSLEPGPIWSPQEFKLLKPGDNIKISGVATVSRRPFDAVVVAYIPLTYTLQYVQPGSTALKAIDARDAFVREPGPDITGPNMRPKISVEWKGRGAPPQGVKYPPRKRVITPKIHYVNY